MAASSGYSASFATSQSGSFTDPFGYNAQWGYYFDREHSYYLCGHRYYDHDGGRWLTRDPIGFSGGINLYSYCGQGPVGWLDRTGAMPQRAAEAAELVDMAIEEGGQEAGKAAARELGKAYAKRLPFGRAASTAGGAALTALGADPNLPEQVEEEGQVLCDELAETVRRAQAIAQEAVAKVQGGANAVTGTLRHSMARDIAKSQGFGAQEISFKGGDVVKYGTPGSVRIDLLVKVNDMWQSFDFKFGQAGMSAGRAASIAAQLPKNVSPPIVIRP